MVCESTFTLFCPYKVNKSPYKVFVYETDDMVYERNFCPYKVHKSPFKVFVYETDDIVCERTFTLFCPYKVNKSPYKVFVYDMVCERTLL